MNNLEYILFGSYNIYKKDLEKTKKLDIATGGEDMSELETEEAEKRMSKTKNLGIATGGEDMSELETEEAEKKMSKTKE